jgi:hypothetical protein
MRGVWPEDDSAKLAVDLNAVVEIEESPFRLPARFANELYDAGESGMGYTVFKVEFRDGSQAAFDNGNAIDFVIYPPGQSASTVARVSPHEGRHDPRQPSADYGWCLFERMR